MADRVATIGVYGATLDGFLAALRDANVTHLLDVRRRRGVRGSEYAWANAQRLQAALGERDAEACHRSLVVARLAEEFGLDVVHLRPAESST